MLPGNSGHSLSAPDPQCHSFFSCFTKVLTMALNNQGGVTKTITYLSAHRSTSVCRCSPIAFAPRRCRGMSESSRGSRSQPKRRVSRSSTKPCQKSPRAQISCAPTKSSAPSLARDLAARTSAPVVNEISAAASHPLPPPARREPEIGAPKKSFLESICYRNRRVQVVC